jgi:environmental stress-induced protein Ves
MTTLIQYASLHPTPWKNGGGCTTEILASPPGATLDDFDFRISLATIAQSGPFSVFPGVDRTLSLVDGGNVVLDVGNERKVALSDREPVVAFPGEVPVSATVDGIPTVDFNVMTRRGRCSHQVERRVFRDYTELERRSALTVLFVAEGDTLTVHSDRERMSMVRYDAVVLDREELWTLEAPQATVYIVDIMPEEEEGEGMWQ